MLLIYNSDAIVCYNPNRMKGRKTSDTKVFSKYILT